jgi:hypothetical protein
MKTRISDLIRTDHELYKQWMYGITDSKMIPLAAKIAAPEGNHKKIVFVLPSFLKTHGLNDNSDNPLVVILRGITIVTLYYCNNPNNLFKREKNAEFQIIY